MDFIRYKLAMRFSRVSLHGRIPCKVPRPIPNIARKFYCQLITRLRTAFYRSFDTFLDGLAIMQKSALVYHREDNKAFQITRNVYDCVEKVALITWPRMTANTEKPISALGSRARIRAAKPWTPVFDPKQIGRIWIPNSYRSSHHANFASFTLQRHPKLPSLRFI